MFRSVDFLCRPNVVRGIEARIKENSSRILNDMYGIYKQKQKDVADLEILAQDPDFKEEAEQDIKKLLLQLEKDAQNVITELLPPETNDPAIIEIKPAAGGTEASLFACDLFEMYQKYSLRQKWKWKENYYEENDLKGIREASATVTGRNALRALLMESGVHRVQRVPKTDVQGRIHTSTVTVAVLPLIEEQKISIPQRDLRIDCFRSGGPGGQHANKTESAVRITHLPSGLSVSIQHDRSQTKNKETAMALLCSKIQDIQNQKQNDLLSTTRKNQTGNGDRSERIRTYNFAQDRVTDHRIKTSLKLNRVMEGELDEFQTNLFVESINFDV